MRAVWFAISLSIALASCGKPQPATPDVPIVVRSEAQNALHKLSDLNRAIGLKRAIYDSGSTCKRVVKSGYVAEHANLSMWTAACDDGKQWAIFVGPDGSAQVRPCADQARFKLPACVIAAKAKVGG